MFYIKVQNSWHLQRAEIRAEKSTSALVSPVLFLLDFQGILVFE